ncbi:FAD-binding oxidoreductase [Hoeflea sp. AS16]|uniref:FAD-binding oxidoreductase n=1 Tax=Hoeflea sp. AS16 TaxID=3135779 RepID=UPI003170EC61
MTFDLTVLSQRLGANQVLTEAADMAKYLADPLGADVVAPLAVVRPDSTKAVADTVKWCTGHGIGIVVQGGLTGLVSGAVPVSSSPCLILSMERMRAVRDLDPVNQSITVEAGAVLADVKSVAEQAGLYLPLSHGGEGSSQIGGNLSTNAGGINALRYGTARDQVLGLEVVLPDGSIWNGLRKLRKNTAGYDLKHLFIGAEGTLGIITAAVLKLRPLPTQRATAWIALETPEAALSLLQILQTQLGETLSAFELLSHTAIDLALGMPGTRLPLDQPAPWYALIETETAAAAFALEPALLESLGAALETGLISDAVLAQSQAQRLAFWALREAIAAAFIEDKTSIKTDTAVPVSEIAASIHSTTGSLTAYLPGVRCAPFGHVGDGNIHFNVLRPVTMTSAEFAKHVPGIRSILELEALKFGGTISAEHGIGTLKSKALAGTQDPIEREIMQRVRAAFDTGSCLNRSATGL